MRNTPCAYISLMAFFDSSDIYLLKRSFDDTELDPDKPPFIDVVTNEDEEHESKGWKIFLSKTVGSGTKSLVN